MADTGEKPQDISANKWHEEASDIIAANSERLAQGIMARHFERRPGLNAKYGEHERDIYIRDTIYNLDALKSSIKLLTPAMFAEHVTWLKGMLQARGIPTAGLPLHFDCMRDALEEILPREMWVGISEYVDEGLRRLK